MLRHVLAFAAACSVVSACAAPLASATLPAPPTVPTRTAAPVATASSTAGAGIPSARAASPSAAPQSAASPTAPAILPGEPWLLYAWFPPGWGTKKLYLARPDGSDAHMILADMPGEQTAPSWSPDGSHIAFVVRDDSTPGGSIWTASADGSDAKELYDGNGRCASGAFYPVWSRDATRIAFICYADDNRATISVLDPARGTQVDLARFTWPEFLDNPPSWSHDDHTIAFDVLDWDPTNQFLVGSLVATVPSAGGPVRRLTRFDDFFCHPDWSPDDSRLAVNTYDLGNMHEITQPSNVYTMAPDGTHLRQLTTLSTAGGVRVGQPRWSAEGRRIWVAVAREGERWPDGNVKVGLAWVDAASGIVHELNLEGKGPKPRPVP